MVEMKNISFFRILIVLLVLPMLVGFTPASDVIYMVPGMCLSRCGMDEMDNQKIILYNIN